MNNDYGTGTSLKNNLLASTKPVSPSKNGFAFVKRTLNINNQIPLPMGSVAMPNLYVPFYLPPYQDGLSAVSALVQMGYKYVSGIPVDESVDAPDLINSDPITGLVTLTWYSPQANLMGFSNASKVTGSVIQNTSGVSPTGAIRSINIQGGVSQIVLVQVDGTDQFNNTDPIEIVASIANPEPNKDESDNIVVVAYKFFSQASASPSETTSPGIWVSVSTNNDASISPSNEPISLVTPTEVTYLGDNSYTLTYPKTAYNLGLLPTTYLGSTIVRQGQNTGTYQGYSIQNNNVVILISNTTGAFNNTDAVTITLDFTQSGFAFDSDIEVSCYGLLFTDVQNATQLNVNYPDYVAGIMSRQSPLVSKNRKYNVQGYYGFAFNVINQYPISTIVAPDSTAFKQCVVLDVNTQYQVPTLGYAHAAKNLYIDLNNDYPYLACSGVGVVINEPASSNPASWSTAEIYNQLTEQGCTVSVPSPVTQQHYIWRNVCGLQSLSGRQDAEYRYEEFQQKLRWYDKNSVEIAEVTCTNTDGKRKNNNPGLISRLKTNLENLQKQAQGEEGVLGNNNSVQVTLNPNDVTKTLIIETISIVSANSGNEIVVYVEPYTI